MTERSLDKVLELVADRHRRRAIQYLRHESKGNTSIDDLVSAVGHDGRVSDERTTDREHLALQMYHAHLPKLAEHDVVEFDPKNRAVRYQPNEQIETVLDSLPGAQSVARP